MQSAAAKRPLGLGWKLLSHFQKHSADMAVIQFHLCAGGGPRHSQMPQPKSRRPPSSLLSTGRGLNTLPWPMRSCSEAGGQQREEREVRPTQMFPENIDAMGHSTHSPDAVGGTRHGGQTVATASHASINAAGQAATEVVHAA